MTNTIVHDEGAASLEVAVNKVKLSRSIIKIGLDVHARLYVAVAQYDHLLPKPARRLAPMEFVPWVEPLLRAGHTDTKQKSTLLLRRGRASIASDKRAAKPHVSASTAQCRGSGAMRSFRGRAPRTRR